MEEPSIPDITDTIAKRLPLRNKNDDSAKHNDVPKSAIKTVSKAQRVALENGEGATATAKASSPQYRTLRNGKRILQTPAKATRVLVEPPAMTGMKALRVPVAQDPEVEVNVNVNEYIVVSGGSTSSEQTAGNCGAADSEGDSSWVVSTNMVPIMSSETHSSPADDAVVEDVQKEEPANIDACLVEMQKAGLVTEGNSSYSCDTHAVAALHGLVNMYTPLPAKTPQNTPAVREKRTTAPRLQLDPTNQEVQRLMRLLYETQNDEVPSPPSSSHVHPSSHALEDSFSLDNSPAPSAPPLKPQHTGTSKVLWKQQEDTSVAPASSTERDAGAHCEQPDMQLQLDLGGSTLASAESKFQTTPQAEHHYPASLEESASKQGQRTITNSTSDADQFATPEPQPMPEEVLRSTMTPVNNQASTQVKSRADGSSSTSSTAAYIPRDKTTPFLTRKLRDIKAKEWSANDEVKVHKSKLEREKEAAAAARKKSMSSVDKTITRKLVQNAVGKAVRTAGRNLGESLVKHKSRLEREKEAAAAQARAGPGTKDVAPKMAITSSAFEGQGLDDMKVHKGRLEREREEVAMRRAAGLGAGEEKPLPSYMRATKASIAMKAGGLGEDMKVHKSQLERDQEAAQAAHTARKKAGVNPLTPFPHKARRSETASAAASAAFGGYGLGDMPKHKSALEKAKEAASKAGGGLPKRAPARHPINRSANFAAGGGLGDMKVHKTRLEKDKEAWDKAAAAHAAAGKPSAKAGTSGGASASYLRPTALSQIRAGAPTPKKEEQGFSDFVPN